MNGWGSWRIAYRGRAGDIDVGSTWRPRGLAKRWAIVRGRQELRTLRDGLLGSRMLLGIADGCGNLILLQRNWMLQDHLYGRAYVEKEMMSVEHKRK